MKQVEVVAHESRDISSSIIVMFNDTFLQTNIIPNFSKDLFPYSKILLKTWKEESVAMEKKD